VLVVPAGTSPLSGDPNRQSGCESTWDADHIVAGGATRSESVRAGLAAVPATAGIVVVHDAARPLSRPSLWHAVLDAVVAGADAAIPATSVTDTVKEIGPGGHLVTLDRGRLVAVQTPQAFQASVLRRAHLEGIDATDDAALVEAAGGRVVLVEGDVDNLKVTSPHDLDLAAALLRVTE
jgi:2-C-methyl-D-erythritol 4-phosphate cytidylyltransferase